MPRRTPLERDERIALRPDGTLRFAVVADTHSAPHPSMLPLLRSLAPDAILHAGDIGDLSVLDSLATVAPVHAVRGNIDERAPEVPDLLRLDILSDGQMVFRILMTHIAVNGPKLRADVLRLAKQCDASLVICGHSHVPLIMPGGRGSPPIFNPGSAGPRRFRLPIVIGKMDISPTGVRFEHLDLETNARWTPTAGPIVSA